jgi:hypothetical protein
MRYFNLGVCSITFISRNLCFRLITHVDKRGRIRYKIKKMIPIINEKMSEPFVNILTTYGICSAYRIADINSSMYPSIKKTVIHYENNLSLAKFWYLSTCLILWWAILFKITYLSP